MILLALSFFRYASILVFGVTVGLLFAGVRSTRANRLATFCFCTILFLIQLLFWWKFGLPFTVRMYPLIAHLPSILFLVLYFERPWPISISSVLAAFLCCQIPRWVGSMAMAILGNKFAEHICYIIAVAVTYHFLKKHVAHSVQELMERSTHTCLFFSAVPFLFYVFDYATTVYTDLLYSGEQEVVQFMPFVVCTYYFVFILLYYIETKKQTEAQRERDILASQLHQAHSELNNMRQMHNSTLIYRHDMRHHLSLIGVFAADGDIQKIKEYLASTEADIDALTPIRYCENETVNLILSTFEKRAKKEGVTVGIDVNLPAELGINDTELCALLFNALENAVAAAAQVMEESLRKVSIRAVVNDDKLIISTENTYVGQLELEGELPKSKNKQAGHGYGIKSMVSIVKRHKGLYSFETEGGIFVLQLLLPLQKQTKDPCSD